MFFLRRHAPLLEEKHELKEVPRAQRLLHRPSLKQLVPRVVRDDTVLRDTTNRQAYVDCGYSMAAIATHADVQYSTVSKMVRGERGARRWQDLPPLSPVCSQAGTFICGLRASAKDYMMPIRFEVDTPLGFTVRTTEAY